jgi:hypothetical protein
METLNLTGVFGMYEMEAAAKHIIATVEKVRSWDISLTVNGWSDKAEQDGFLCLIAGGFLASRPCSSAHGEFVPTKAFIKRVKPRLRKTKWGIDLKDPIV